MGKTFDYINSQLRYEPDTGLLFWKVRGGGRRVNRPAGGVEVNGYIVIAVNKKRFKAHRLAWLLSTGRWPGNEIDHINYNKTDNRLVNLREATHKENMRNSRAQKNSKSGFVGVSFYPRYQKWRADIYVDGKTRTIGYFTTIDEAKIARKTVERVSFGEFAST